MAKTALQRPVKVQRRHLYRGMTMFKRFAGTHLVAFILLAVPTASAIGQTKLQHSPEEPVVSVTLLGTAGGPPPHINESQPATLLRAGGKTYLIDSGENVGQQLVRAGSSPRAVNVTFLTHLHWDHVLGLGYLMASGWMLGRQTPMPIWGPPGTSEYVSRELAALQIGEDIFRPQAPGRPPLASMFPVHEANVGSAQQIYDDGTVRVLAVANTHYAQQHAEPHSYGVDKSYSYRFETAKGSVTITGDTGPSEAVERLAKGSDILVSEICDFDSIKRAVLRATPNANVDALLEHLHSQHLSAREVGKLAQSAGVKTLVLTHYVIGPDFDPDDFTAQIRPYFPHGKIIVGRDLVQVALDGDASAIESTP
ncbi:MBL fold metallo-hydrolase [Stakelama sp. CBK3Z-3]|uniref:MBL fold metallo-hydrolase n=1 Tax=Stakelama flava TaxID=2860338 RepID=A0ABS6XRS2_9SPHN|nr:MBL fold metallo-hydrolase [Stakelama flava]MBW4332130.1 MBL fold metallo-hydrolase [Stakelama flava]